LIAEKLLEPVDSSEWAGVAYTIGVIVPVVKVDESSRLCRDYKVTVNKNLVVDRYPIPRVNKLLSKFQGERLNSVLELLSSISTITFERDE